MSLEFNRRSFLKYSAAAAVAVAGSSLLTGCGEDEYQKTGKIGSTLKLMGTFKMYGDADAPTFTVTTPATATTPATGTFKCKLKLKCTTDKVPLAVTADKFLLTVNPGKNEDNYYGNTYVTVEREDPKFTVDDGERDFTITVKNVKLANDYKVEFIYFPRIQASNGNSGYTRAFCTWKMTAKKDATTGTITLE